MAADTAITLKLLFEKNGLIAALDLSSLIFDLNRLYVLALKFPGGEEGSVSEFRPYGRNSYRVSQDLRLNVVRIRFESPGLIELMAASAAGSAALWALVQTLERLASWPLNKQKLRLEVMKLEREIGRTELVDRKQRIEPFFGHPVVRSATKQLDSNPLKAADVVVMLRGEHEKD